MALKKIRQIRNQVQKLSASVSRFHNIISEMGEMFQDIEKFELGEQRYHAPQHFFESCIEEMRGFSSELEGEIYAIKYIVSKYDDAVNSLQV